MMMFVSIHCVPSFPPPLFVSFISFPVYLNNLNHVHCIVNHNKMSVCLFIFILSGVNVKWFDLLLNSLTSFFCLWYTDTLHLDWSCMYFSVLYSLHFPFAAFFFHSGYQYMHFRSFTDQVIFIIPFMGLMSLFICLTVNKNMKN